ncbi:MAG: diguanylate cyclase domain-containing protein [Microthrixaceae bacterium]
MPTLQGRGAELTMGLPGRDILTERLDQLITTWTDAAGRRQPAARGSGYLPEPAPPAIYAIGIDSYRDLSVADEALARHAMAEVTRRLDRLVRSSDVLGVLAPGRFGLAAASVAPSTAGVIMERMTGAVAMPLDLAAETVSLSVTIGVAFAFDGATAQDLVTAAEMDLDRPTRGR